MEAWIAEFKIPTEPQRLPNGQNEKNAELGSVWSGLFRFVGRRMWFG